MKHILLLLILGIPHLALAQETLLTVYFDVDQYKLKETAENKLDSLIMANEGNDYSLILTGHTDVRASDEYNQELSLNRVKAVMNYLAANGVDPNIIKIQHRGEKEPVSETSHQLNRRVEIQVDVQPPLEFEAKDQPVVSIDRGPVVAVLEDGLNTVGPFDVQMISNTSQMLQQNIATSTTDGTPIVSRGMACWTRRPGTTPPPEPILVRIPLVGNSWCPNSELRYFSSSSESDTSIIEWAEEADSTPRLITLNGQEYMEFYIVPGRRSDCVNADCPKRKTKTDTLIIKSRRYDILAIDVVYPEANARYQGKNYVESMWALKQPADIYEMPPPRIRLTIRDAKKGRGYAWLQLEDLKEVRAHYHKVKSKHVRNRLDLEVIDLK